MTNLIYRMLPYPMTATVSMPGGCAFALLSIGASGCATRLLVCHRFAVYRFTTLCLIIIILFQEDNIFGTNSSLTYGPQIQKHTYVWYLLTELKLFTVCTPSMRRAGYPILLPWRGGGTIYPGPRPADVTTRSPIMVAECLLSRSMLIKMYYHFMVCACSCIFTLEPGYEKMFFTSYANNKNADQPAHPRSLISAFVISCWDSIISLDSIAEISRL